MTSAPRPAGLGKRKREALTNLESDALNTSACVGVDNLQSATPDNLKRDSADHITDESKRARDASAQKTEAACRMVIPVSEDADDAAKAAGLLHAALSTADDETRALLLNGAVHECSRLLECEEIEGDQRKMLVRTYCEALTELGVHSADADVVRLARDVCLDDSECVVVLARANAELDMLAAESTPSEGPSASPDSLSAAQEAAACAFAKVLCVHGTLADVLSTARGSTPLTDALVVRRAACTALSRHVQPSYRCGDALPFSRAACASARVACDAALLALACVQLEDALIDEASSESESENESVSQKSDFRSSTNDASEDSESENAFVSQKSDTESSTKDALDDTDALWTAANHVFDAVCSLLVGAHILPATDQDAGSIPDHVADQCPDSDALSEHDLEPCPVLAQHLASIAQYANVSACLCDANDDAAKANGLYALSLRLFRAAASMDAGIAVPADLEALVS